MQEKSVLELDEIPEILSTRYGFSDVSVVAPLGGGSANLWTVSCDGRRNVLKEFQSKFQEVDVCREPEINLVLRQKGLPVVSFIETTSGEFVWTFRKTVFHLQRHAKGRAFRNHQAPHWLLRRCAQLLAEIHEAMAGVSLPTDSSAGWFKFDPLKLENDYSSLLRKAENLGSEIRGSIVPDLEFRRRAIAEMRGLELRPQMFTYKATHGDFHPGQLLVLEDEVVAIVDFSMAANLPAVWEIIRSYTIADPMCKDGSILVQNLVEYVQLYLEKSPLLKSDVENMLKLYHWQLLRSKYGYREYLNGTEDPHGMLSFALWRTKLCRWLEKNMVDATSELTSALSGSLKN